jgi:hypothetical protein
MFRFDKSRWIEVITVKVQKIHFKFSRNIIKINLWTCFITKKHTTIKESNISRNFNWLTEEGKNADHLDEEKWAKILVQEMCDDPGKEHAALTFSGNWILRGRRQVNQEHNQAIIKEFSLEIEVIDITTVIPGRVIFG